MCDLSGAQQRSLSLDQNSQFRPLSNDAPIYIWKSWLSIEEADRLYSEMMNTPDWEQGLVNIYGRRIAEPRLSVGFGEQAYIYSGRKIDSRPFPKSLSPIVDRVNAMEHFCEHQFNTVLCNLYRNGDDYMGWHQDNELELGINPQVLSISLGATRIFRWRRVNESLNKGSKRRSEGAALEHGDLLWMGPDFQHRYQHKLGPSRVIQRPRISLTFRKVLCS